MSYPFKEIENKWQNIWLENKVFTAHDKSSKPKYYALIEFPYPSAEGLHVGHPRSFTAMDIIARKRRMEGHNVLFPIGWDAFGLPAENFAIKHGIHPLESTRRNIANFKRQLKMLGFSYDWDREINTTDPGYFKWTQWIFIRLYNTWFDSTLHKGRPITELFIPEDIQEQGRASVSEYTDKHRLAYYADAQVWWCEHCRIVCSNEEVLSDGTHEKCGNPVIRKNLKQWLLRIPHYAERLLDGLDQLDWPEGVKDMQKNWIGRSTGADVNFQLDGIDA